MPDTPALMFSPQFGDSISVVYIPPTIPKNLPQEFIAPAVITAPTPPLKASFSPLGAEVPATVIIPSANVTLPKRRRRRRKTK